MGDIRRWIEEQEEDKHLRRRIEDQREYKSQRERAVKDYISGSEEDIRNEERKKFIDLLEDEADAMDDQMTELLEKGTLGGKKCPQKYIKEFASERKILRDGYLSLAEYMRNKN